MALRVNDEKVKLNIYHDKKSLKDISTCHRVDIINSSIVDTYGNEKEESWKEAYEDAKIFKKRKRSHKIDILVGDTSHLFNILVGDTSRMFIEFHC